MSLHAGVGPHCPERWRIWAVAIPALIFAFGESVAQSALPPGFVYLRDVDPTIAQDMRYASADNFVGRPLPGYDAPECVLRRDAALALKQVQADLALSGLALKVYDCYRPARAVQAMAQWANDGKDGGATRRFFPKLQKNTLFALGYISSRSEHSMGIAIDLTLVETPAAPTAPFDRTAAYGPCTGPATQRAPDNSLDMGTGYDCFDALSHTSNADIGAEQRRRRRVLVTAMSKRGFRNYHREWWHFSYGSPAPRHDIPIRPRPKAVE
jgi:zinc D-Ala-D-Ala dipeptidase